MRRTRSNPARSGPTSNLGVGELGEFLGAAIAAPTAAQPPSDAVGYLAHEGWPCRLASPLGGHVRATFPIEAGEAALRLASGPLWCIAPGLRRGYLPIAEVQLVIRGWKSAIQQVYLPEVPAPQGGMVVAGEKCMGSASQLEAWYARELRRRAKAAARALVVAARADDGSARMLFPHDIWAA